MGLSRALKNNPLDCFLPPADGRAVQALISARPNKNPHGGVRHGDFSLVRKMGLEPTRHRHTHLKRACLPIPALPQIAFDCKKDSSTFGGIKSSPILHLFSMAAGQHLANPVESWYTKTAASAARRCTTTAGGWPHFPRGGETMPITLTFHVFGLTVTITVKSKNRHSAK